MKKAFTLFSVLVLLFVFSLLGYKIFEVKSINSINIINQYKYIQAKNHLLFLEQYIKTLNDYSNIEKISIDDKNFQINAFVKNKSSNYQIELIVQSNEDKIRVQKLIYVSK